MLTLELRTPYLVFLGDEERESYAKTGKGLVDWRPEVCAGQLRLTPSTLDLELPDLTIDGAADAGVGSVVVGTALIGGSVPDAWIAPLCEAAARGIDVVAGLHTRLAEIPDLVAAAEAGGARLVDVRTPPPGLPIGNGAKRPGKRLLTVGTDCALGKKYTALQLEKDMRAAGLDAEFRASGQTGIMIAGRGIPIDCVVADFLTGAAEVLSPAADPAHWDVIEGQGALFHPGYAPVTQGLLLGSQPDAFVVCHAAGRTHIGGWPDFALPTIGEVIERTCALGRLTNPDITCVGISVNTSALDERERWTYLEGLSDRYGLPAVDPMLDGTGPIVARLIR